MSPVAQLLLLFPLPQKCVMAISVQILHHLCMALERVPCLVTPRAPVCSRAVQSNLQLSPGWLPLQVHWPRYFGDIILV